MDLRVAGSNPVDRPKFLSKMVNGKKSKILLIEDDPVLTEIMVAELQKSDFETIVAKTGREGMESFRNSRPDLVILDIVLPDGNGFETLREIRRLPEGRGVKVMVFSNVAEGSQIEEAERLGVAASLLKVNFSAAEVVEKIKQILGQE